jgi:hypothetical protein
MTHREIKESRYVPRIHLEFTHEISEFAFRRAEIQESSDGQDRRKYLTVFDTRFQSTLTSNASSSDPIAACESNMPNPNSYRGGIIDLILLSESR